jgi:hypothetical protein
MLPLHIWEHGNRREYSRVEYLRFGIFPVERLTKLGVRTSASLGVHWTPQTEKTETRRGASGDAEKQEDSADNNVPHGVDLVIVFGVAVGKLLSLSYDGFWFCEATDVARQGFTFYRGKDAAVVMTVEQCYRGLCTDILLPMRGVDWGASTRRR